ncbi:MULTISPECIES: hypothetical protein [Stenotrophomonas]|uniref:Uncharacterized protein n=1 Tax=Stenotrophomonas lactitubi TaxID=2045214 RepID=A0ABS2V7S0_9GAMM|nr:MULTISPECIES: hypothetical protein [Stenotrophomonas]MBM9922765.1 hypothetical protein [Stenotrophomonas lactitubi]MBM9937371.1 hypothetical protein [Stenotrophomonas lactitubi]
MSTKVDTYRIDQALRTALVAADLGRRFECVSTKIDTYRWVALRGVTGQR